MKLKGKEPIAVDSATYLESAGRYLVTQGRANLRFSAKEVEYVRPPRPKNFSHATNDIPKLEEFIKTYHRLWWDVEAFKLLMPLYGAAGESAKAAVLYEDIRKIIVSPMPAALQRNYWDALRSSSQSGKLDKELEEAIRNGSRELAANAYLVRGDALAADNKRVEALVEGYLKTVVMFDDVAPVRKEALEQAIKTMEEIHDPRAERLRKMLNDEFPGP
jgi:hypothetical protein